MNHRFAVVAALSVSFALPAAASAAAVPVTLAQAQAAVSSARNESPEKLARLAQVPVEFAGVLIAFRYGSEPETGTFDTPEHARAALAGRAAYWNAVAAALAAEQSRLDAIVAAEEPLDAPVENPYSQMRELMAASHRRGHADAIRADIAADQAYISGGPRPGPQALIDRKAALYRRLAPPAPEPSTFPCP
jgi:hypothetical protein